MFPFSHHQLSFHLPSNRLLISFASTQVPATRLPVFYKLLLHPLIFKMQYTTSLLVAAFAVTNVLAHGVITEVQGANGVSMPGLTVVDGTPRDCPTAKCGAQSDTAIIRTAELGTAKASALGRTTGSGPVDATKMVAVFMDGAAGMLLSRGEI
jgi:hypothetical protein